MDYNKGYKYNYPPGEGGATYNSSVDTRFIWISDSLNFEESDIYFSVLHRFIEQIKSLEVIDTREGSEWRDYNKNYNYNSQFLYNSANISKLIHVNDGFYTSDSVNYLVALNFVRDNLHFLDELIIDAIHLIIDDFFVVDNHEYSALFEFVDSINLTDKLSGLIVALTILDNIKLLDEIKQINALLEVIDNDNNLLIDDYKLNTLIKIADKYKLIEAKSLFTIISYYDTFGMTDKSPQKAISDFVIGVLDDMDNAYDWIYPFKMKVDWRNTLLQTMPETESNYIDMPSMDGSIIEDTTYKNRIFNITAFSEMGLSIYEKEQLKHDIVQVLDSTKNNPKKFTVQSSGMAFDVIYSGVADITEGPSYVKAIIPFETSPYGYPLFDNIVSGSGLIVNNGDADIGCVHEITSGCVNPQFRLGGIIYRWNGIVPTNSKLVIDHNSYSCYLKTGTGVRTNVIDKLTGEFQVIPKHSSVVITAIGNTGNYLTTTIKEKILWGDF